MTKTKCGSNDAIFPKKVMSEIIKPAITAAPIVHSVSELLSRFPNLYDALIISREMTNGMNPSSHPSTL